MGEAKNILLRPITRSAADELIRRVHYSGKIVPNSQFHIGVFYKARLEGALQFGPSTDKGKMIGLVSGTKWNGFIELNRMAFTEALPRNSESRALSVAMNVLKKHAPHIEWVVTFADGTQCGDGTIYRAAGFLLTGIKKSVNMIQLPDGRVVHKLGIETGPDIPRSELGGRSYNEITNGAVSIKHYLRETGGRVLPGFQFRYIRFLNPAARARLMVPVIPYSEIGARGIGMYRGVKQGAGSKDVVAPAVQAGEGGSIPTPALQP